MNEGAENAERDGISGHEGAGVRLRRQSRQRSQALPLRENCIAYTARTTTEPLLSYIEGLDETARLPLKRIAPRMRAAKPRARGKRFGAV
ncbi:MAG: hypothetical protein ACLRSW_09275 [Christensenellaceae bacterium]